MKFESDKEIDGLLRRHARREAASSTPEAGAARLAGGRDMAGGAARASAGGAHLDADEMNAYAENALPDGARARYVAHLADCDECRGLVIKLTLAAGVTDTSSARAAAIVEASPTRSWREWLAALLAPPVLRYAVPAIALMAVMVVAFVALRERRNDTNLVAQNEQGQASTTRSPGVEYDKPAQTAATETSNTTAAAPGEGSSANTNAKERASNAREADAPVAPAASPAPEKAGEPNAVALKSAPQPIAQESPDSVGLFGRQQQRSDDDKSVAQTEKPQPPPPPADLAASNAPAGRDEQVFREEARKSAGIAKAKNGSPATATTTATDNNYVLDGVESKQPTGGARRAPQTSARARGKVSNTDETSGESSGGPASKDERNSKKEDSETETRSVGGRAFRNRGGVWIDTAYSSSRATVNVRRNSEQYRALVADEPGIGNIVNQLGSPVIIVWKSRAYRIY